jgi:hypothetical protein
MGEVHRAEQERYRQKLREHRIPEAPRVDAAVASAVAVAFARLRDEGKSDPALEAIVSDSRNILKEVGYASSEAGKKLMHRLLFRKDLDILRTVTTKPLIGRSSPRYSRFPKRISPDSRSEEPL